MIPQCCPLHTHAPAHMSVPHMLMHVHAHMKMGSFHPAPAHVPLFLAVPAAVPSNALPSTPTHDVNQLTDPRLHLLTFLAPPAQSRSVTIFSSVLVTVVTLRNAVTLLFLTLFTTGGVFWLLTISGVSWGLHFLPHLFSPHCQCRHLELECLIVFIY